MKELLSSFYFSHDYNAHNDERLLMLRSEHGAEAYGVFWMILESMAMASTGEINRGAIGGLSLGYGVPKDRLSTIIDYCLQVGLFEESQHGAIYSVRMQQHLASREVLRVAGRKGAEKRWSASQKVDEGINKIQPVSQKVEVPPQYEAIPIATLIASKVKESKVDTSIGEKTENTETTTTDEIQIPVIGSPKGNARVEQIITAALKKMGKSKFTESKQVQKALLRDFVQQIQGKTSEEINNAWAKMKSTDYFMKITKLETFINHLTSHL